METRGWTQSDIERIIVEGQQFRAIDKTAGFTPATRYMDPLTGRFVVVNNGTGTIVQVSDIGFIPNEF
jgi:Colicin E5 ribonuclease domain